jgi:hypothetical protein
VRASPGSVGTKCDGLDHSDDPAARSLVPGTEASHVGLCSGPNHIAVLSLSALQGRIYFSFPSYDAKEEDENEESQLGGSSSVGTEGARLDNKSQEENVKDQDEQESTVPSQPRSDDRSTRMTRSLSSTQVSSCPYWSFTADAFGSVWAALTLRRGSGGDGSCGATGESLLAPR